MFEKSRYWIAFVWRRCWSRIVARSQPVSLGRRGEQIAEKYLRRRGYQILERNFDCRFGEVDLIAVDQRAVVFVEVKTRTSDVAGRPESAVGPDKQAKIVGAAKAYLQGQQLQEYACRFDVVAILFDEKGKPQVEHFVSAFEEAGA